jgi:hypothetical protein
MSYLTSKRTPVNSELQEKRDLSAQARRHAYMAHAKQEITKKRNRNIPTSSAELIA